MVISFRGFRFETQRGHSGIVESHIRYRLLFHVTPDSRPMGLCWYSASIVLTRATPMNTNFPLYGRRDLAVTVA